MAGPRALAAWRWYECPRCRFTQPRKLKYVMVGYTEQSVGFGFFLNSNLSYAATKDKGRMSCEIRLEQGSQRFIKQRDSYLDCGQIFRFTREDFSRRSEKVAKVNAALILAGVDCCPLLTPIQQASIRAAAQAAGYPE